MSAPANPYELIRMNVVDALERWPGVRERIATLMAWRHDKDIGRASDRGTLLGSWLRVETISTEVNPFAGAQTWVFRHVAQVVVARPIGAMQQGLIEQLEWEIVQAIADLTRNQGLYELIGFRSMTVAGGRYAIVGGDDKAEVRETAWSVLLTVTTEFERFTTQMADAAPIMEFSSAGESSVTVAFRNGTGMTAGGVADEDCFVVFVNGAPAEIDDFTWEDDGTDKSVEITLVNALTTGDSVQVVYSSPPGRLQKAGTRYVPTSVVVGAAT